jgi:hypothetical protein
MTDTASLLRLRAAELLDCSDKPIDQDVAAELEALAFCYLSVACEIEDEEDGTPAIESELLEAIIDVPRLSDTGNTVLCGRDRPSRAWRLH